jgi:hypothetical protein
MSQKADVLRALKEFGKVDRKIAINELGVWNLPEVIRGLRSEGYFIETITRKGVNRYGRKVEWGEYILMEKL